MVVRMKDLKYLTLQLVVGPRGKKKKIFAFLIYLHLVFKYIALFKLLVWPHEVESWFHS